MKKHLFFNSGGSNLFGCIHMPEKRSENFGVIIVHPFAEEKVLSHRAMVNLSERFEMKGIASFRFDFMGHGDSEGDFEDSSVKTRVADLKNAVSVFRDETGISRIALFGVRFGAAIAMIAVEQINDIENLVLISPVIDGEKYIKQVLRTNLTYQMASYKKFKLNRTQLVEKLEKNESVNIDGYLLSGAFYKQMCEINLLNISYRNLKKVLIIDFSKNETPPKDFQALGRHLNSCGAVPEFKAVANPPVWKATNIYDMDIDETVNCVSNWLFHLY